MSIQQLRTTSHAIVERQHLHAPVLRINVVQSHPNTARARISFQKVLTSKHTLVRPRRYQRPVEAVLVPLNLFPRSRQLAEDAAGKNRNIVRAQRALGEADDVWLLAEV